MCITLAVLCALSQRAGYATAHTEVANWPGIGWLARATGTVFIQRNALQARKQKVVFTERLQVGHKLLFFPEGTSTDSLRVLPFKSSLFAAFFEMNVPQDLFIQPVTVIYHARVKSRVNTIICNRTGE